MRRLFAAAVPSEAAKEHLVSALRPVRDEAAAQLRWTEPDDWHMTLAFYGEQPNDPGELAAHLAVAAAGSRPLELNLTGAGSFNSRTLWIGVGGDTKALRLLMADALLDPEERARQRAHLTVARASARLRDTWLLPEVVRALSVYSGPSFRVEKIALMESHLGEGRGGGPRYEVLETIQL